MRTELILFGNHINMASRARRRRLVIAVYTAFAALMLAGWFLDRWRLWGALIIIVFVPKASSMVFGGYGVWSKGMLKPFLGNEIHSRYIKNPNSSWSRLCKLNVPQVTDERAFLSDEREVRRRDSAHEMAYRWLGAFVIFTLLIACIKNLVAPVLNRAGITVPASSFDLLIYGLLIASFIFFITLPQAVLLWTEPEMEDQQ
jgi:hypothetical protein